MPSDIATGQVLYDVPGSSDSLVFDLHLIREYPKKSWPLTKAACVIAFCRPGSWEWSCRVLEMSHRPGSLAWRARVIWLICVFDLHVIREYLNKSWPLTKAIAWPLERSDWMMPYDWPVTDLHVIREYLNNVMAPYKGSLCPCFLSPWFLRVVMQYFGNELGNCLATWEIRLMMILTCNRKCRLTLPQARYCMTCQGHLILLFSTYTWSVNIWKRHGPLQRQLVSLLSVALVLESGHAVFWKWAWQLLGHLRDQINDDTDL